MRKALVPTLLLVVGAVILGATVFREQLVQAATTPFQNVVVTNTSTNPIPVQQQGPADVNVTNSTLPVHQQGTADVNVTNSTLPVHQQGTADVNVTNSSLSVAPPAPVTDGGDNIAINGNQSVSLGRTVTASALSIHLSDGVCGLVLKDGSGVPASFAGPACNGNSNIVLALFRPVSFDAATCTGGPTDVCAVDWIGNSPS